MTADIRTAAQAEAGARVVAVTVVRQEIDSTRVIGQYYRVEPCLPTREQIADELRKHKLIHASVSREAAFCVCNSSVRCGTKANREWFEQHQADAVLALMQEVGKGRR